MNFYFFKRRHEGLKMEFPVSKNVAQRKTDLNKHSITGDTIHRFPQNEQMPQVQTTNESGNESMPSAVNNVISSKGEALDANTRTFMESAFGHDFSQVRVHTDAKAAESSDNVSARAYTAGNHIVFNASEYNPGTLAGDALIGHELAHVVQQKDMDTYNGAESSSTPDTKSLEDAADISALGVVVSILSGAKTMVGQVVRNAALGFRAGLRLQRCAQEESIQAPSFLGAQSRETLERINSIIESGGALQQWIVFGQVITSFENPISAIHTPEAAEALEAVPTIVRARLRQEIELLLVMHGNELNLEEREFWETLLGTL